MHPAICLVKIGISPGQRKQGSIRKCGVWDDTLVEERKPDRVKRRLKSQSPAQAPHTS